MKTTKRQKLKGFTLVELLVVIAIIAVLAGIGTPLILRARKAGDRTEAANNAKALAGGLNLFRDEEGSYPSLLTREGFIEDGVDNLPEEDMGANAYLAQLVVGGYIDSEKYFYAPGVRGVQKGDDLKKKGKLLEKNENGFAYIMSEDDEPLSGDISITPIVIAPLKKAGENPEFDPSPYDGKYVYGSIDGSSQTGDIGEKGVAKSEGRASLFEQGVDSLFGSDIPVVKPPAAVIN
jgi:prepilin-type N-terminal cleavage/methylation domain-containing protein